MPMPCDTQDRSHRALDRRTFLKQSAGAALAAFLSGQLTLPHRAAARTVPGPPVDCPRFGVFDDVIFARLVAVAEQIVPTDQDPGATGLCCASFAEAVAAGDPGTAALVEGGLEALDEASVLQHGLSFVDLPFDDQTALLALVEAGQAPGTLWDLVLPGAALRAPDAPLPTAIAGVSRVLHGQVPGKPYLGGAPLAMLTSGNQLVVFGTLRTLSKLGFVLNFPEMDVRDANGQPIFSDSEHLISDPDDPATATGWTIAGYHEIDWEAEKLMWAWQAGYRVVGFDGVPVLDTDHPLSESARLEARDALYARSDAGLA